MRANRRGSRSKSIVLPDPRLAQKSVPIAPLNYYDKKLKKVKGPLSLVSKLESIDEVENSEKLDSS